MIDVALWSSRIMPFKEGFQGSVLGLGLDKGARVSDERAAGVPRKGMLMRVYPSLTYNFDDVDEMHNNKANISQETSKLIGRTLDAQRTCRPRASVLTLSLLLLPQWLSLIMSLASAFARLSNRRSSPIANRNGYCCGRSEYTESGSPFWDRSLHHKIGVKSCRNWLSPVTELDNPPSKHPQGFGACLSSASLGVSFLCRIMPADEQRSSESKSMILYPAVD